MTRQKITKRKVKQILELLDSGLSRLDVRRKANVSQATIAYCVYARRFGLKTHKDYRDLIARKSGFESFSNYVRCRNVINGKKEEYDIDFPTKQNDFERLFDRYGLFPSGSYRDKSEMEEQEIKAKVWDALNHLTNIEKEILTQSLIHGKTLYETAKTVGMKGTKRSLIEMTRQRKLKALLKLRKVAKQMKLEELL